MMALKAFKRYYYDVIFQQYGDISGRATRKEYWMWCLFWGIVWLPFFFSPAICFSFDICDPLEIMWKSTPQPFFSYPNLIYIVLTFLPFFSLIVRRLHDAGSRGIWSLLVFVPGVSFVFIIGIGLLSSTPPEQYNKYGPNKYAIYGPNGNQA
jgi:uncharacterized membrane protein YhaH (DUF805 family)